MTLIESMNDNFKLLPKIFVCDLRLEGPVIAGCAQAGGQGVKRMPLVPLEMGAAGVQPVELLSGTSGEP